VIHLITLGLLSVTTPRGVPTALASRRRALGLLVLVGSAREGLTRDRVMALLWPESDADDARNSLKQTVFAIRRALDIDVFDRTTTNLRLDPSLITVDLHHFERAVAVGAHDDVVADYTGPFLDGFFLPELREFERWVERMRQRVGLSYARSLETLAVQARLRGDVVAAVHWYRRLVEHDPISTTSVLGLMSALADASEPLEALECFRVHRELLREEFDAEPDPKIRFAAEQLRRNLAYRPSGPHSIPPAITRDIPHLPPLFGEPERTTRRTSGPALEPPPAPTRRWW
jgi:DNA-binding SARP family transcriptional activator